MGRAIRRYSMRDNMADETIITAPSTKTARTVPIGAEVTLENLLVSSEFLIAGVDDFPKYGFSWFRCRFSY